MATSQRIKSNLWFDTKAEEAVNFYVSVFKNSRVLRTSHYGKAGFEFHGMPEGSVMTIEFELDGQKFVALNGGPHFKFNEAISFIIDCKDQQEVDYYWNKLTEGGDPASQQCGWLKDKFGLSWQVVPSEVIELLADKDYEASQRAMNAVMHMKKIDIGKVKKAFKDKELA